VCRSDVRLARLQRRANQTGGRFHRTASAQRSPQLGYRKRVPSVPATIVRVISIGADPTFGRESFVRSVRLMCPIANYIQLIAATASALHIVCAIRSVMAQCWTFGRWAGHVMQYTEGGSSELSATMPARSQNPSKPHAASRALPTFVPSRCARAQSKPVKAARHITRSADTRPVAMPARSQTDQSRTPHHALCRHSSRRDARAQSKPVKAARHITRSADLVPSRCPRAVKTRQSRTPHHALCRPRPVAMLARSQNPSKLQALRYRSRFETDISSRDR
jgi:hypothetical protein